MTDSRAGGKPKHNKKSRLIEAGFLGFMVWIEGLTLPKRALRKACLLLPV